MASEYPGRARLPFTQDETADGVLESTVLVRGEPVVDTSGRVHIGDGVTPGGVVPRIILNTDRQIYAADYPYFADPDGVRDSTDAIQRAIDRLHLLGGGDVVLHDGIYKLSASGLSETFDNDGVAVPASWCGLVQRAGVAIVARNSGSAVLFTDDNTLMVVAQVAPVRCALVGLEIHAAWDAGEAGAGHGIFVLGTAGGADRSCRDNLWSGLKIHNVASYGLGLQAGVPTRCRIENCDVWDIGADGFDLKARSDTSAEPNGNTLNNVTVRNHGQRVDGANGVDLRGIWHVSKVTVTDFGGNPALNYGGVRFRTKPPVTELYNRAAARTEVSDVYVRPTIGAAAASITGIENGSDDIELIGARTDDCTYGYRSTGNANGSPMRATIVGMRAINSRTYGIYVGNGSEDQTFIGCHTIGSATAGIRNEGTRSKFIAPTSTAEATPISTSTAANATQIITGGGLGPEAGFTQYSAAAGRVEMAPAGPSANIDGRYVAKGAGAAMLGGSGNKISFFGGGGATKQTLPAAATDAATTMALANAIRTALIAYGQTS